MSKQHLIVGMGASGLSVAGHWHSGDCLLTVVDNRRAPPKKTEFEERFPEVTLRCDEDFRYWGSSAYAPYERIAVSPGIDLRDVRAPAEKITNDAACFSEAWRREAPSYCKLLAVTGTNGKSTAASLAAHLINSCGISAEAIGNIGEPMLDALARWRAGGYPQVAVAELSSFHLEVATRFYSDAAVALNVSSDHLDRHGDLASYAAIKKNIYSNTRHAVMNAQADLYPDLTAAGAFAAAGAAADWTLADGWICRGGERYCSIAGLSPACGNYLELALAALALTEPLALPPAMVTAGLASYAGLPHRRQVVDSYDHIIYIDDSKATNVDAALFALRHIHGRAVWIGGGDGKGQDFTALAAAAPVMRAAVLLGKDAAAIEETLAAAGVPCERAESMADAVRRARALAQPRDCVLLSPACSSLDMFSSYHARGMAYAEAVREQTGGA